MSSLPKFVALTEKNLRRNGVSNAGKRAPTGLKRGVLYMRGSATSEELAELGAQPTAVIPLGLGSQAGEGAAPSDWGYSSVFHFTSEDIFRRAPARQDGS